MLLDVVLHEGAPLEAAGLHGDVVDGGVKQPVPRLLDDHELLLLSAGLVLGRAGDVVEPVEEAATLRYQPIRDQYLLMLTNHSSALPWTQHSPGDRRSY